MALNIENLFFCKLFDPPIHKILDEILKVFVAEVYLLSLLRQLKWSLNFLPDKLLYHAASFLCCFPSEGEEKHCYWGTFLMLSSVQSRCIWFHSQNMPTVFSLYNCHEEVILPRYVMLLENTVLEMPGYALKAYFYSWVKAESEDCFLVF